MRGSLCLTPPHTRPIALLRLTRGPYGSRMSMETLSPTAGQLAARGSGPHLGIVGTGDGWGEAVHRAALLLEPAWPTGEPKLTDPDAVPGLETLALLLYVRGHDTGAARVPPAVLLKDLEGDGLTELLRRHLEARGHYTGGADQIAKTFEILAERPLPDLMEVPSVDQSRREPLLHAGSRWAAAALRDRPPAEKGAPGAR